MSLLLRVEAWRRRLHPLHRMRRSRAFRRLAHAVDRPVWARLYGVPHPVRLYALRNGSYLVNRRSPEPRLAALMMAILRTRTNRRFWDVGANIGYYSWLVAAASPGTSVLAIEPDPTNVAVLLESRAQAPRVDVLDAAVSSVDGTATFLMDDVSGATGTLERDQQTFNLRNYGEAPRTVEVRTRRLDSIAAEWGFPDLLKIDVEGHEHTALQGAADVLARHPLIVMETFDAASPALEHLRSAGYGLLEAGSLTDAAPDDGNYLAIPEVETGLLSSLQQVYRRALIDAGLIAAG